MIRPEQPQDFAPIRALHLRAFAPSTLEAQLVDDLRAGHHHVPHLCLRHPQGHVMISKATIDDRHPALGLGPLAVDPGHQQQGIGGQLMRAVIEAAQQTDYTVIALLGHPTYYPRFGFAPARATFEITTTYEAPDEAWMALPLPAYAPGTSGVFRYAPPFP